MRGWRRRRINGKMGIEIFKSRAKELLRKLKEKKGLGISQEELHKELRRIGDVALKEGNLYNALNAYLELNDRDMVNFVGGICLSEDWLNDANRAFEFLGDRNGILKVIQTSEKTKKEETLELALKSYLCDRIESIVYEGFKKWALGKGFSNVYTFEIAPILNMVYNLNGNYDLGIGIAKGGLFSTYLFNLFGLNTKVVESHRKNNGATFNWISKVNAREIHRKNIVVFDKDVVSGRTTRKVLKEIQRYNPEHIDLVLVHDPIVPYSLGMGTVASHIPEGYNNVYYPKKFDYQQFDKVVERLEQKLERQVNS